MKILASGAFELGIVLSDRQLGQFETYYQQLVEWNQRVNLTAITDYHEVQVKHFLDSLTLSLAVAPSRITNCRVIDVGAGAGLPGLPLKIAFPDISLTLAEATGKKTRFLQHLVDTLGFEDVAVCTGRAEELAQRPDLRESFDLVLARGVAKLAVLSEYTLPFCALGGQVAAWKHVGIERELSNAQPAIEVLGGRLEGVHRVSATGLSDDRVLIVLDKVKPTPEGFPRRAGRPAKQPL